MVACATASDRDLQALAEIVSRERPDLPDAGLPFSLLSDLATHIPCDRVMLWGYERGRRGLWLAQGLDHGAPQDETVDEGLVEAYWTHYRGHLTCSYRDRTGDLRSIVTGSDFYSVRQLHSTGMYRDVYKPFGTEHDVHLCLPEPPRPGAPAGRNLRLIMSRGPGPDFTERDRALLTLLRPHLYQAYLDAERRRSPPPSLTPRQWELMHLVAAGCSNKQIARQLGLSVGTVRTHLEKIYGRLGVSNRTAAVARTSPERVA